ncbi:potassium-transporting ATPase subunit F, partial [Agreia sp.]
SALAYLVYALVKPEKF